MDSNEPKVWTPSKEETEQLSKELDKHISTMGVRLNVPTMEELAEDRERFLSHQRAGDELAPTERFEPEKGADVNWESKFRELERIWQGERLLLDEIAQAMDDLIYNPAVVEFMKENGLTGRGMAAHRLLERYRRMRRADSTET